MNLTTLTLTNEELRSLIPNVIHEVEGEPLLVDKLTPWIESAKSWLAADIVGESFSLPESLLPHAKKIIVYKAFAEAVPSLDVTLSPAGFAVISTEGRAPASKERIERLVASLKSFVDANLPPFVASLLKLPEWRDTAMGEFWLEPFIGLDSVQAYKKDSDLLTAYYAMREPALTFLSILSRHYLGSNLLEAVRDAVYVSESNDYIVIWNMIHRAVRKFLVSTDFGKNIPDEHMLSHHAWHYAQPILMTLRSSNELHRIWESEMGDKFRVEPFKNTVKGGFFF